MDEGELFGSTDGGPTGCDLPNCYDPATRTKWWGSTIAVVSLDPLVSGGWWWSCVVVVVRWWVVGGAKGGGRGGEEG